MSFDNITELVMQLTITCKILCLINLRVLFVACIFCYTEKVPKRTNYYMYMYTLQTPTPLASLITCDNYYSAGVTVIDID